PLEYRSIIKESGEKWNEAFEKAGFKNAVVMKQMPDDAKWDPADVSYNVIRWVSSAYPSYGAIGPSFFNPLTGQILGADITVEWKSGAGVAVLDELYNGGNAASLALPWENPIAATTPQMHNHSKNHAATCMLAQELSMQYQAGLTAIEALDADAPEKERAASVKEMHKQFLYYLIMHEMGHTLGLNHNMKASQMLSPKEMNDTKITHKIGLQGSVMDYPAINISNDRSKQGDYYTTKAGPYDWWAIEYGYTPFSEADEEAGLNKILSRSTDPQLAFGNDADDMRSPGGGIDPRVNVNDHSNDMVTYGEDRFKLINTMMPKLKARFSKPNQSYQELRSRYQQLNGQRSSMAARGFGFFGNNEDIKPLSSFMSLQLSTLAQLLHPNTLTRINNSSLYGNTYSVAAVMNDLTADIFDADLGKNVNPFRQNLQTEFVKASASIANAPGGYDNASKAAAFATLSNIKTKLNGSLSGSDEQTTAHRKNLMFLIEKAVLVK
ncbi:MAG: Matrixin, partial [Pedobacter sp.]